MPPIRIEIERVQDDRASGRPLMRDHNLTARLWAMAALVSVPLRSLAGLGWWLPVHLAMIGAASQAIVGGQLMFTATLGSARGPSRQTALQQLALLNLGGALVIGGRLFGVRTVLALGATVITVTISWAAWEVRRMWRRSIGRRFAVTGTFYSLAALCILAGASIGLAMGTGAFKDPASYLAHRDAHMALNVLGWAGLSIVGTAITLLPTIMHVRAPRSSSVRATPWLMFTGLVVFTVGKTTDHDATATLGMATYAGGIAIFGFYLSKILATTRRRKVPTAALHLVAALTWLVVTTLALGVLAGAEDRSAMRDFIVVGGVAGFVFQALLGAWSFLLPSERGPVPDRRRRELTAMEIGGRSQSVLYNLGLIAALFGLRAGMDKSAIAGIVLAWGASAWALLKTWTFPLLATLPTVRARSEQWWSPSHDRDAKAEA